MIGLTPKNALYGQYGVTSSSLWQKSLYTKMKNCPVQQRICLYGLGMTWPLVGLILLLNVFSLLIAKGCSFATTQQLTSVISHLKVWETELFHEGKDKFGVSPVLDIYLEITTEHSRIQWPHCSQKWRIKSCKCSNPLFAGANTRIVTKLQSQ